MRSSCWQAAAPIIARDWNPPASDWQPGNYEVQLFVGTYWWQSGRFTVTGAAPAAVATLTPTLTRTPLANANLTHTPNNITSATPTP